MILMRSLEVNMRTSTVPADHRALRTRALLAQADYRTAEGKKFQERHFPDFSEKRWERQAGRAKGPLIFFGMLAICGLGMTFFSPHFLTKVILAGPSVD